MTGRRTGAIGALYTRTTAVASSTWSDSDWQLVGNVRDATYGGETGKADLSARDSVWRQNDVTLIDGDIEFTMVWDDADTDLDIFREAWLARTAVAVAGLSATLANDGQGIFGNFKVAGFERSEPLEDAMVVNITLTPYSQTYWKNAAS